MGIPDSSLTSDRHVRKHDNGFVNGEKSEQAEGASDLRGEAGREATLADRLDASRIPVRLGPTPAVPGGGPPNGGHRMAANLCIHPSLSTPGCGKDAPSPPHSLSYV